MRRAAAVAVALLAGALIWAPAAQATSYRYWTYWGNAGGDWTFSSVGPASAVPPDGSVEGWRFAVTEGVRGQGERPRIAVAAAFDRFCGDKVAPTGSKRVAVVFDFGDPADAPQGQTPPASRGTCVIAPTSTNGARILSQAAVVRTDRGLVCAIGGFPADECAPALTPVSAKTSPDPRASQTPDHTPDPSRTAARNDPQPNDSGHRATPPPATDTTSPESGASSPSPDNPDTAGTSSPRRTSSGTAERHPPNSKEDRSNRSSPDFADPAAGASTAAVAAPAVVPAFIEAPADDSGPTRSWLPMAATAVLILCIAAFVWLRRRS